jgi:hypothetical protein
MTITWKSSASLLYWSPKYIMYDINFGNLPYISSLKSTSVSLIAECDGSGEPNIEPQVRDNCAFYEN